MKHFIITYYICCINIYSTVFGKHKQQFEGVESYIGRDGTIDQRAHA